MQNLNKIFCLICAIFLSACTDIDKDVKNYVAEVKRMQPSPIVDLPPIKQYSSVDYTAQNFLSPFEAGERNDEYLDDSFDDIKRRPDADRKREFLEHAPLDSFVMVGTLSKDDNYWGLVQDKKGMVHVVRVGDYIGKNSGQVIKISTDQISIIETVEDSSAAWVKVKSQLKLKGNAGGS